MEVILLLILFTFAIVYLKYIRFDFFDPGAILILTFLVSSFTALLFMNYWKIHIGFLASFIIVSGVSFFILGSVTVRNDFDFKLNTRILSLKEKMQQALFKTNMITLQPHEAFTDMEYRTILIVYLFAFCFLLIKVYQVAAIAGNDGGLLQMIPYARYGITHYGLSIGRVATNILRFNYALGIVLFYKFTVDIFKTGLSYNKKRLLMFPLFSILITIFSTGRTEMFGLIFSFTMLIALEYSRYTSWKRNYKTIKFLLLAFVIFVGLFIISGVFILQRMGDASFISIINNLGIYFGSSIPAFSYFIDNYEHYIAVNPHGLGQNIFLSIAGTLKTFGFISNLPSAYLPRIVTPTFKTNVYTYLYPYYLDFGYFGVAFFSFINGVMYTKMYKHIRENNCKYSFANIIYAIFSYGLVIMFFQEGFWSLINTHLVRLLAGLTLYLIFVKGIKFKNWKRGD